MTKSKETGRRGPAKRSALKLDPADVRAYVDRDWSKVAESKAEYWAERKRRLGLVEVLRVMSELRDHARALNPNWPTPEERGEDLQVHIRVAQALSKVASKPVRRRRTAGRGR